MPALSRAAIQLHMAAAINSLADGHPGFVSDDYLNAIAAETTTAAVELETAGMWERRDGGYLITADEAVKIAIGFNERTDRQKAECAQRGKHLPSGSRESGGWVICGHCGIPTARPDGGPVALPGGGPLGPDLRPKGYARPPLPQGACWQPCGVLRDDIWPATGHQRAEAPAPAARTARPATPPARTCAPTRARPRLPRSWSRPCGSTGSGPAIRRTGRWPSGLASGRPPPRCARRSARTSCLAAWRSWRPSSPGAAAGMTICGGSPAPGASWP